MTRTRHHILILAIATALVAPAAAEARAPSKTPQAAADALVAAIRTRDEAGLRKALGANFRKVLPTGHLTAQDRARFLAAWDQHHAIKRQGKDRALVAVGKDGWTLPVPLVRKGEGWRFDTRAGATEMRKRRIGRDELAV